MRIIVPLALAGILVAPAAIAQDVRSGREIAETWCKGCHNVAPGAKSMHDTGAPPFAVVANTKGMTTTALTAFLFTSHNRMPDYSLTRKQVADVSAYIVSLKTEEGGASR